MRPMDFQPDLSKYEPLVPSTAPSHSAPTPEITGGFNSFLICPMPLTTSANSDGLRQYYRSGVPQTRLVPPGRALFEPLS